MGGEKESQSHKDPKLHLKVEKKKKEIIQGKYIQSMKFEYFFW